MSFPRNLMIATTILQPVNLFLSLLLDFQDLNKENTSKSHFLWWGNQTLYGNRVEKLSFDQAASLSLPCSEKLLHIPWAMAFP